MKELNLKIVLVGVGFVFITATFTQMALSLRASEPKNPEVLQQSLAETIMYYESLKASSEAHIACNKASWFPKESISRSDAVRALERCKEQYYDNSY